MSYDGFCKRGEHELTALTAPYGWYGQQTVTIYCIRCPFHYNPQSEYLNGKEEEAGGQAEAQASSIPASEEVKSPWATYWPPKTVLLNTSTSYLFLQ